MKKLTITLAALSLATAALADSRVQWRDIAGVITAQGVNNPISVNISSGAFAWTANGGRARADLGTGALSFDVDGLVINGSQFSGTSRAHHDGGRNTRVRRWHGQRSHPRHATGGLEPERQCPRSRARWRTCPSAAEIRYS